MSFLAWQLPRPPLALGSSHQHGHIAPVIRFKAAQRDSRRAHAPTLRLHHYHPTSPQPHPRCKNLHHGAQADSTCLLKEPLSQGTRVFFLSFFRGSIPVHDLNSSLPVINCSVNVFRFFSPPNTRVTEEVINIYTLSHHQPRKRYSKNNNRRLLWEHASLSVRVGVRVGAAHVCVCGKRIRTPSCFLFFEF